MMTGLAIQQHQLVVESMSKLTSVYGEASAFPNQQSFASPKPNVKKKRSRPGNPDLDAEVIALSPKTLMATNRFVCEVCNKGFPREQNLQLHRRCHNLPGKLKQRSSKEVKKVYICPKVSCVPHDPSRALGDLTGIKKHYSRKHGENKWKCDKCDKKYAIESDWMFHSKICGTRKYRCDCGTLFSRNLCRELFVKWLHLDDSHFSIERISGGFTNLLLKLSVREDGGNDAFMTVRLYGPNTELVIDRKREMLATPYLSAAGFGAELLGIFGNGMVQSFIDARTLSHPDMSNLKIAAEIAKQLRKFHQVEIPGSREPQLWNDIFKFLGKAAVLKFNGSEKQEKYKTILFNEIREEISTLKDLADSLCAPVVFAHNDLLPGNLMRNDEKEKLYFIDFEYGSYSYRGYDIANHFNEYPGFTYDYSLYPDKEAQYYFFRNYLQPDKPQEVPEEDLEVLYSETNTFRLASHIYWALWALIQANVSPLDVNYLGYFFLRHNEYKKQMESFFSPAKRSS